MLSQNAAPCVAARVRRAAVVVASLLLVSCSPKPASRPVAQSTRAAPRIDATLTLPQGDGRVHVIAIPSEFGEVTRCVVAVSSVGMIAASCAPKEIELPAVEN